VQYLDVAIRMKLVSESPVSFHMKWMCSRQHEELELEMLPTPLRFAEPGHPYQTQSTPRFPPIARHVLHMLRIADRRVGGSRAAGFRLLAAAANPVLQIERHASASASVIHFGCWGISAFTCKVMVLKSLSGSIRFRGGWESVRFPPEGSTALVGYCIYDRAFCCFYCPLLSKSWILLALDTIVSKTPVYPSTNDQRQHGYPQTENVGR
jgi:hypothetical protein